MRSRSKTEDAGIMRKRIDRDAFLKTYEKTSTPVVLLGLCSSWWPQEDWTLDALLKRFADVEFALNNGQKFSLKNFANYARDRSSSIDAIPLYLFDDLSLANDDDLRAPIFCEGFSVPNHF